MSECRQCGAPMQEGQDWCLQCGAGAPGSLAGGGPGWRTGMAILATTALLVAGASVAAYAALTKSKPKRGPVAAVVKQQTFAPVPTTPGTTPGTTPPPGNVPGIPTTVTPSTPAPAPTPKSSEPPPPVPAETNSSSSTKSTSPAGGGGGGGKEVAPGEEAGEPQPGAEPPSPILLDTNAASVYNPYGYPASLFGDPSLTIDGEAKTAWTAQVQPEKAPHMAEGLLLDLRSAQKLGSATVKTATTGASVEIYGANGGVLPASITDAAWKRLVGLKALKKKDSGFKLKTGGKSFRYIVLWLAKAPPGSTAAKPGHVAIGEFELFPPG